MGPLRDRYARTLRSAEGTRASGGFERRCRGPSARARHSGWAEVLAGESRRPPQPTRTVAASTFRRERAARSSLSGSDHAGMDVVKRVQRTGRHRSERAARQGRCRRRHLIEKAVAEGGLVRIRRRLGRAPRRGSRRSARRPGMGVVAARASRRPASSGSGCSTIGARHVAARPHAGADRRCRRGRPCTGLSRSWRGSPTSWRTRSRTCVAAVALCQPYERALAIIESALRKELHRPRGDRRLSLTARASRADRCRSDLLRLRARDLRRLPGSPG